MDLESIENEKKKLSPWLAFTKLFTTHGQHNKNNKTKNSFLIQHDCKEKLELDTAAGGALWEN